MDGLRDIADDPLPRLTKFLEDQEYDYLCKAMTLTKGNGARAARIAGRDPVRFYKRLKQFGLSTRAFRKQGGFSTLIVYGLLALAALAALGGLYGLGYKAGSQAKQVEWDAANQEAQAKADEERRGREALARAESAKLQSAQARARDFEARWRTARAGAGTLAVAECPASPPGASTVAVAGSSPDGGVSHAAPVVRVTAEFVRLWDGSWSGPDGKPVFPDTGGTAEKAAPPGPTIGAVLDNHAENASRCSETSRQLGALIDLIGKLR